MLLLSPLDPTPRLASLDICHKAAPKSARGSLIKEARFALDSPLASRRSHPPVTVMWRPGKLRFLIGMKNPSYPAGCDRQKTRPLAGPRTSTRFATSVGLCPPWWNRNRLAGQCDPFGLIGDIDFPVRQPMRSDTGIRQAAALSGQIHPSACTNTSRITVQTISTA